MTLAELAQQDQEEQIQRLNNFLAKNHQGKLTGDKSPVDVAIELLDEYKKENVILSSELLKLANRLEEWASEFNRHYQFAFSAKIMMTLNDHIANIRQTVRSTKFFKKGKEDD